MIDVIVSVETYNKIQLLESYGLTLEEVILEYIALNKPTDFSGD